MGWEGPKLAITSVHAKTPTVQVRTIDDVEERKKRVPHEFVATGSGFDEDLTQLLFVQAGSQGLRPWQVIPCRIQKVEVGGRDQVITFTASLYERGKGPYHLIAMLPDHEEGVNHAAVLEFAMSVTASPDAKDEDRKDQ